MPILCHYEYLLWVSAACVIHLPPLFFSDCTYIQTDETDETASGGGFDSFENWFQFQQNKWENQFRILKSFTQQMDSFQNQVRT